MKEDPRESQNIYSQHPEIVEELKGLMTQYIRNGRSTPGLAQKNDGPESWAQLKWMD